MEPETQRCQKCAAIFLATTPNCPSCGVSQVGGSTLPLGASLKQAGVIGRMFRCLASLLGLLWHGTSRGSHPREAFCYRCRYCTLSALSCRSPCASQTILLAAGDTKCWFLAYFQP